MSTIASFEHIYTPMNVKTVAIPDGYSKFGCCAIRCDYTNCPLCLGCKSYTNCCCFRSQAINCKRLTNESICCVCNDNACECISCRNECSWYRQCCCCECFCGSSFENYFVDVKDEIPKEPIRKNSRVLKSHLIPYRGLCCDISSCFCSFPECCGCYNRRVCFCIDDESLGCIPLCCFFKDDPRFDGILCACHRNHEYCICPQSCCKVDSQLCCIDHRCQCPCACDDEIPCLCFFVPFCTLFVNKECNIGCCRDLETIVPSPASTLPLNQPAYVFVQQPMAGAPPPHVHAQPIQGYAQPIYAKA